MDKKEFIRYSLRLISFLAMPFVIFYWLAVKLRIFFYRSGLLKSYKSVLPVVSIGNITWGGTGKTPLAEAVSLYFSSLGKRIGILTRGYGGDEERLLKQNIPTASVLIGKDRVKNAVNAEKEKIADIFVLEDGFQHLKIKRDLDIVAINATNPFGNGFLIPAGILREPVSHLSRADMVVITKADIVDNDTLDRIRHTVLKIKPGIEIFYAIHQPDFLYSVNREHLGLEYIRDKGVCAVAGLADNSSFALSLKNIGAKIRSAFFYMDHHKYTKKELEHIVAKCREKKIGLVLTTEKDWVKLKTSIGNVTDVEFLILKIKLKIKDEENFFRRVSALLFG